MSGAGTLRRSERPDIGREVLVDDSLCDVGDLRPVRHRLLLEEPPRLLLGHPVPVHEASLRPVDRLPSLEPGVQVADLLLERAELGEAPERDLDGGDEVALLERLHEVRERAGITRLLDQVALARTR